MKGKCLHYFDENGFCHKQGQIEGEVGPDVYLVRWFDWLNGDPLLGMNLVRIEADDPRWRIYDSLEDMKEAWELLPRHKRV